MNNSNVLAGNQLSERLLNPFGNSVRACKNLRGLGFYLLTLCVVLQIFIDASIQNIASVAAVYFTALIIFAITFRAKMVRLAPLPVVIVTGYNMATMSGALVTQTLYFKPLVYNLAVPEYTFPALILFQMGLLAAFLLFANSSIFFKASDFARKNVLVPAGLLKAPLPSQVWLMGIFGLFAIVSSIDFSQAVKYGDAGPKFIEGFVYLTFMPFTLPALAYIFPNNNQYTSIQSHYKFLLPYFIVLVLVGISANTRGGFAGPAANMCLILFLLFVMGQLVFTRFACRGLLFGAIVIVMASPTISDLATAMVVVRGERDKVSTGQLMLKTFDAFQNKKEIESYRRLQQEITGTNDYEENYITNPFLTRLILTKFTDNMLSLKHIRNGRHTDVVWEVTIKTLMGLFPTPVLRFFGSKLDKEDIRFSIGDALYAVQNGIGLGEYKLGSSVAHGVALMGAISYLVIIPIFLIVFIAVQSFTFATGGLVVLSPLILLQLISLYFLPIGDSFFGPVIFLVRTLPQNIITYMIAFHCAWLVVALAQFVISPARHPVKY